MEDDKLKPKKTVKFQDADGALRPPGSEDDEPVIEETKFSSKETGKSLRLDFAS